MNKRVLVKVLSLILIAFIVFSFVYEVSAEMNRMISPWSSTTQFDNKPANANLRKVVQTPLGAVLNIVRTVAVVVAVCMLLYSAIRYMAPNLSLFGKALDQAEVKRDIPRFIIGSILLFGTSGLLTFIQYVIEDVV